MTRVTPSGNNLFSPNIDGHVGQPRSIMYFAVRVRQIINIAGKDIEVGLYVSLCVCVFFFGG